MLPSDGVAGRGEGAVPPAGAGHADRSRRASSASRAVSTGRPRGVPSGSRDGSLVHPGPPKGQSVGTVHSHPLPASDWRSQTEIGLPWSGNRPTCASAYSNTMPTTGAPPCDYRRRTCLSGDVQSRRPSTACCRPPVLAMPGYWLSLAGLESERPRRAPTRLTMLPGCGSSSAGAEAERGLALVGLGDVVASLADAVEDTPQNVRAVLSALAQRCVADIVHSDPLTLGAALLSLLEAAAAPLPLLLVMDDFHWLDEASTDALVFGWRRLHDAAVAVLVTTRPPLHAGLGCFAARADLDARRPLL